MGQQVITRDGRTWQQVGSQWRDVTPTAEELAAEGIGVVEAAGVAIATTALDVGRSVRDFGLAGDIAMGFVDETRGNAIRAEMLAQSTDDARRMEAIRAVRPGAALVGEIAAGAPLAVTGAGAGASLARVLATEGGIGAAQGFFARPGSMASRVQNAGVAGVMGATGAAVVRGGSIAWNTGREMIERGSAPVRFEGAAEFTTGQNALEFETVYGVPRLGPEAQAEYRRLASTAEVSGPDMSMRAAGGTGGLDAHKRAMVHAADDLGIALKAGQRTGNQTLQRFEAALASNPLTSQPFDDLKQYNRRRLNDIVYDNLGLSTDAPLPGVISGADLGRAHTQIGDEFRAVQEASAPITLDAGFADEVNAIDLQHRRGVGRSRGVRQTVKQLRELSFPEGQAPEGGVAFGTLDPEQFMDSRSAVIAEIQKASVAGDGNTMTGLYKIVESLDDAFLRSNGGNTDLLNQYGNARSSWRLLDALEQGKALTTAGDVNAGTLDTILRKRYPVEYLRSGLGLSPVFDAVKVLSSFPDIVGDSGTATRSALARIVDQPVRGTLTVAANQTLGRAAFGATQSATGSRLFTGGRILADPARSAAAIGRTIGTGLAASEQN
jgi:hypothetical protein